MEKSNSLYQSLDWYIDIIPEIIQEIALAGYINEEGDWEYFKWQSDPIVILSSIRKSLQEIYAEQQKKNE